MTCPHAFIIDLRTAGGGKATGVCARNAGKTRVTETHAVMACDLPEGHEGQHVCEDWEGRWTATDADMWAGVSVNGDASQ